jgi:hypothetical protein
VKNIRFADAVSTTKYHHLIFEKAGNSQSQAGANQS